MTDQEPTADDVTPQSAGDTPRSARAGVAADSTVEAPAGETARKAERSSEHGPGAPGRPVDELPYVDDPVTKWWVGIIVAVFVAIFAYALLLGQGGLLSGLLPGAERATPSPAVSPGAGPTSPATTASPVAPTAPPTQPTQAPSPTVPPPADPSPSPAPALTPAMTASPGS